MLRSYLIQINFQFSQKTSKVEARKPGTLKPRQSPNHRLTLTLVLFHVKSALKPGRF